MPPLFHTAGIGFVALAAGGYAAFIAVRRPDRRHVGLRLAAIALATLALLLAALRPTRPMPRTGQAVVLLTEGAERLPAARLAEITRGRRVFALPGAQRFRGATPLPGPALLATLAGDADSIIVAGYGIDVADRDRLPPVPIRHEAPPPPAGITTVLAGARVSLGRPFVISGTARGATGDTLELVLAGPGGPVDSVRLAGAGPQRFTLRAIPRDTGAITWSVSLRRGEAVLETDTIGVEVTAPAPPRLLVVEASPRFTTRYLRDWLGSRGGTLRVRSTLTRGRTSAIDVNPPATRAEPDLAAAITTVDLLLIDGRSLAALPAAERAAIRREVSERGLGVLLIPDDALRSPAVDAFFKAAPLAPRGEEHRQQVRPRLEDIPPSEVTPVDAEPFTVATGGRRIVMEDAAGEPLVVAADRGAGRVGVTLVAAPEQWVLRGEPRAHAAYWTAVLSALARPAEPSGRWRVALPALVDAPTTLVLEGRPPAAVALVTSPDGSIDSIYLAPALLDSTRWRATFWPRRTGWHAIAPLGDATIAARFFVSGRAHWTAWRAARLAETTAPAAPADTAASAALPARREIPALIWFGLFLLAMSYLWWEQRPAVYGPRLRPPRSSS
ncbi:MAG: hypothetical protein ACOY71_00135 [Gemmatimonadota bacterium]